jgi:hypothetical protein
MYGGHPVSLKAVPMNAHFFGKFRENGMNNKFC